ncbi:MAG: CAP domain-containing protein [Candidatus Poribacteria bacterium]|nr:CAP domain-containing protein [Candidatus Poribacteria bacterium]
MNPMSYDSHPTRLCCLALLPFIIAAMIIGCEDAKDDDLPAEPESPLVVTTDPTPLLVTTNPTQAEAIIFSRTNAIRVARGRPPLELDDGLSEVARAYSQLMLARNFFSHVTPDGKTLSDRFADAQIRFRAIAENLARYEGVFQAIPAAEVVEGWLNSPGHRVNLLDEKGFGFTHIGIGIAIGKSPDSSQPVYYYTQLFWLP